MNEPKADLTLFRSKNNTLAKTFGYKDGKVSKEPADNLSNGTYAIVQKSLAVLKESIREQEKKKSRNWCICLGTPDKDKGRITTTKKHDKQGKPDNPIPRTKEHFKFKKQPTLLLIDIDGIKKKIEAIMAELEKIMPAMQTACRLVIHSSSAGIKYKGELVKDSTSVHVYMIVEDGTDIPRFMEVLFNRLWIAGHGHIDMSASGSMLVRSLIDKTVASPERIIYEAAPILKDGLTQDGPEPELKEGGALDTSVLLDLNEAEQKKKDELVKKAKDLKRPEADQVKAEYKKTQAKTISKKKGITLEKAMVIVEERLEGLLNDDDILYFADKPEGISVGEVLDNGEGWNEKSLADPIEPNHGGNGLNTSKAKFYWNDGRKPLIQSFAFGGVKYQFKRYEIDPIWSFEDADFLLSTGDCKDSSFQRSLAEDILLHNAFDEFELEAIQRLIKKQFKINIGTQKKVLKNAVLPGGGLSKDDDRTHHELSHAFCFEHLPPPSKGEFVAAEGSFWKYNKETGLFDEEPFKSVADTIGGFYTGNTCRKGSDYTAITKLVYNRLEKEAFFSDAPYGIAAKSNFIKLSKDSLLYEPYTPAHKQRFKFEVDPVKGAAMPLFSSYLASAFSGDEGEKDVTLLQEIIGGMVIGCFSKLQRAVLLLGTGSNGKSVLLELIEAMFPPRLVSAIYPADFDKQEYLAELAGKVVNIVGEVEKTKAFTTRFKDVAGCDKELTARRLYKNLFKFKPRAAQVFASNHFPLTKDHSYGFYRRWVVIEFKQTIATKDQIPNLGARIAKEELPGVLAWCLAGAERLLRNNYKLSKGGTHEDAMHRWHTTKDSVLSFLADDEIVVHTSGSFISTKKLYETYRDWCPDVGVRSVGKHEFLERCRTRLKPVRYANRRCFADVDLIHESNSTIPF